MTELPGGLECLLNRPRDTLVSASAVLGLQVPGPALAFHVNSAIKLRSFYLQTEQSTDLAISPVLCQPLAINGESDSWNFPLQLQLCLWQTMV